MDERNEMQAIDQTTDRVLSIDELAPTSEELCILLDEKRYGDFIRRIQDVMPVDIAEIFCECDRHVCPSIEQDRGKATAQCFYRTCQRVGTS